MTRPSDWQQRQDALNPQASFICEAPAGSGKTELLTQRFLNLLSACEQPEEILAITFTRKATAEMRHRVIAALELGDGPEPEESHKKLSWQLARNVLELDTKFNWQLLSNPGRLQIFTFDSLCSRIANRMPLHSRLGGSAEATEDAKELYETAVENLFLSLEQEGNVQQNLSILLAHRDNSFRDVKALLYAMLVNRDAWLPLIGRTRFDESDKKILEESLQHLIEDTIEKMHRVIPSAMQNEIVELCQFAATNLAQASGELHEADYLKTPILHWHTRSDTHFPDSSYKNLGYWQGIVNLLFTQKNEFRKSVNVRNGFPTGKGADSEQAKAYKSRMLALLSELTDDLELSEKLADVSMLPAPHYSDDQWQVLQALTQLLPVLVAQLKLVFSETGLLDFSEINHAALAALGGAESPSDIALRLDYSIKHILVDEFQDTSSSQVTMLEQLTAGWQEGDGRTLFCVGDAMQSIYSFRNARVSLFLHCKSHGIGNIQLTPLQLEANFRSSPSLVDWVNSTFSKVFPRASDISSAAVSYSPSVAAANTHSDKNIMPAVAFKAFDANNPAEEGEHIANIIEEARQRNPVAKIAILLRKKSHAHYILPALQRENISYQAVDLEPLTDNPVVRDLLALTHALLNPGDRIAWLAILRAPWCGLSLQDLLAIANTRDEENKTLPNVWQQLTWAIESAALDGLNRAQQLYRILKLSLDSQQRRPLRQWIEGSWFALGGGACLQSNEDRENAAAYFNLLEDIQQNFSLEKLETSVARLFAAPNPDADDSLQLMTIHKSKGLEFDVVILPSLHSAGERNDSELMQWRDRVRDDGTMELLLAPIAKIEANAQDTFFNYLKYEKRKSKRYEDSRLLYVACTRAKSELHLSAGLKQDSKDPQALASPSANSFLERLWNSINSESLVCEFTPPGNADRPTSATGNTIQRLPEAWRPPNLEPWSKLDSLVLRRQFAEAEQEVTTQFESPAIRHVGTLVHAILCEASESGLPALKQTLLADQTALARRWAAFLSNLGVPKHELDTAVQSVLKILMNCIDDETLHWMYSSEHQARYSEHPVSYVSSNKEVQNLVLDLLVVDKGNTAWVIDFKTSEPKPEQKLESFLEEEMCRYKSKMFLYQHAVSQLGEYKVIKSALYFPKITKLSVYSDEAEKPAI